MDEDKIENFGMEVSKKCLVFAFAEGLLKFTNHRRFAHAQLKL